MKNIRVEAKHCALIEKQTTSKRIFSFREVLDCEVRVRKCKLEKLSTRGGKVTKKFVRSSRREMNSTLVCIFKYTHMGVYIYIAGLQP